MLRIPKNNVTTKPLSGFAQTMARISFGSAALFFVIFTLLHIIKPEIDPSWRFISEYQLGNFGWMMHGAFGLLAVSSATLWLAIQSQIRTAGGYIGLFLLAAATVGFVLAAIFPTDPLTASGPSDAGRLHNMGAILGGNICGAAYFLGWSLARNKAWAAARKTLLWITGIALLGQIGSFWMQAVMAQHNNTFGPEVLVGWPNRLLIVGLAGWLLVMALKVMVFKKNNVKAA